MNKLGVLLDTNVLSELMRPAPSTHVLAWFENHKMTPFYTSAITQAELLLGVALLPRGKRRDLIAEAVEIMFKQDFSGLCLSFDDLSAQEYATLVAVRSRSGLQISTEDAQIAAIALRHGLALATRNTKDFINIVGLNLIDPWFDK